MKRAIMLILSLLVVFIAVLISFAAVYNDKMEETQSTDIKNYTNLTSYPSSGVWSQLSDNTFLVLKNIQAGEGAVVYKVSNAGSIAVNTYSMTGTTVYKTIQGEYTLTQSEGALPTDIKPQYSRHAKKVYILADSRIKVLTYDNLRGYIFKDTDDSPTDLINYSINIFYSKDGKNYIPLAVKRIQSIKYPIAELHLESWSALVNSDARFLKIEINDAPYLESFDSKNVYPKTKTTMTMLANIEISGNNLILGNTETIKNDSIITTKPADKDSVSSIQKDSKETSSAKTSVTASKKTEEKSIEQIEQQREAQVTTKPSTEDNKVSPTSKVAAPPKPKETLTQVPPEPAAKEVHKIANNDSKEQPQEPTPQKEPQNQPKVYYVEKKEKEDSNLTKIVNAYIVAVICIIILMILRATRKQPPKSS